MSLTSADKAFATIAKQKGFVSPEVLAAKEADLEARNASGERVALADYLVDQFLLDKKKKEEVERIRARHGRTCEACSKETFLLPGDVDGKKPCEFCGGKLRARAGASGPVARPPAPAPASPAPASPSRGLTTEAQRKRRQDTFIVGYEPSSPEPAKPAAPPAADAPAEAPPAPEAPAPAADAGSEPAAPEPTAPGPATAEAPAPALEAKPARKVSFGPSADELAQLNPIPEAARPDAVRPDAGGGSPRVALRGVTAQGVPSAPRPTLPLAAEVAQILGAPVRGRGLIFVTVGSLLLGLFGYMSTHTMFPYSMFVGTGCALVFVYLNAFILKTANASTAGRLDLPDWPDWEEAVGTGWPWDESGSLGFRLLIVQLACLWPYILCLLAVLIPSARRGAGLATIGDVAAQLGSASNKRTGKSVASELLANPKDEDWRIGDRKGHWLVLYLHEKDTGDDTGMDRAIRAMPKMLPGMVYLPANQPFDLDRVAKALPEVDVATVFIDPRQRYMRMYGLVAPEKSFGRPTPPSREDEGGLEGLEVGPDGQRKAPIDPRKLPGGVGQGAAAPGKGPIIPSCPLVLRTRDYTMPGALSNTQALVPTIWIIDPTGVVRRELEGGCSDKQLYAMLKDFMAGGDGNVDPELLPLRAYGLEESVFLPWLATFLWWAGVFYYPIAILLCTVFTTGFVAWRYPVGIAAIVKTSKDYLLLVALFGGTLGVAAFIAFAASIGLRNQGAAFGAALAVWLKAWLSLYASLVIAVGIGRYYVRHDRELNWLSVEESGPSFDATAWRADGSTAPAPIAPAGPRFGPPPGTGGPEPREAGTAAERLAADEAQSAGALKVLAVLNGIPKSVEIGIAVLGLVVACLSIKAEMKYMSFDAAALECMGKLAKMTIDTKADLVRELKKEGYEVTPDEIQLVDVVKYKPDGELAGVPQAFVTVDSRSGYHHQARFLAPRSVGKGGFEVTEDPGKVWPAPAGQDKLRYALLVGGLLVFGLFAVKAFLLSKD